jgi:hypothetical protein
VGWPGFDLDCGIPIFGWTKETVDLKRTARTLTPAPRPQDIASNVSQAARGTTEVSRNIVDITDASRTVGSAASKVFEAAERLTKQSEVLRDELRNFTATIRAA